MLNLLSDDIQFENYQNNEVTARSSGKSEFRKLAEYGKTLFTERKQSIIKFEENSNCTSISISFYGKLATDLPNGMKAGEELRLQGLSEFIFADNKICSIRDMS